ncbi:MAG: MFS transporter [Gammaproteobacteria bacterium]|nr:MFS transporter [Gammaproteobacteria bacterium]MDH5303657.1 MFS transporter [Gammaproteobacteria bacterium]MDH5322341.1 MFS transporter [Gammaproteobacteria bacterium]
MQSRNLVLLVLAQLISATGAFVFVTLGGIIGASLAANAAWATLPLSMIVLASAMTTMPAAMLMKRIGRRLGFALASGSSLVAVLVAAWSLQQSNFALFLLAALLFGINVAFTQQYRYAAAESVDTKYVPRAISLVLVGSIGGALIGPAIVTRGQDLLQNVPYAGSMLILAVLYVMQTILLLLLGKTRAESVTVPDSRGRTLADLIRQPVFMVAVLGGVASYGLMTLLMTATPLSMHINDSYSLAATAEVIRAHVLAMYVPSLVSGFLIERLGVVRMMFAGTILLLATAIVGLQGHTVMHYWWALVLLGVGWNFLYVGATTMLTYTYSNQERFRAQGLNEFLVFGSSATASLLAGTIMHYYGWYSLMLIPFPVLLIIAIALLLVRRQLLLRRPANV